MMKIKILGRYRDPAGTARRAALTTVGRGPGRRAVLGSTESARSRNIEPSRLALLLVAGIADGRSEKPGFRGPMRNGQNLERELIKGHRHWFATLLDHSASHSERLFLPQSGRIPTTSHYENIIIDPSSAITPASTASSG